jgi:hypothetical protein
MVTLMATVMALANSVCQGTQALCRQLQQGMLGRKAAGLGRNGRRFWTLAMEAAVPVEVAMG